jgi:hypothetical protein
MDTFVSEALAPSAPAVVSELVENVTYDEIAIGRTAFPSAQP